MMSSKTKTESKGSPEEAVKAAVQTTAGGTTEGIAQVAGIGRSTAGKVLGRLADAGEVIRHQGGRDRGSGCRTAGRSPGSRCPRHTPGMCSRPSSRPVRRATARASRHLSPTSRPAGRRATGQRARGRQAQTGWPGPARDGLPQGQRRRRPARADRDRQGPRALLGRGRQLPRAADRRTKKVKLANEKPRRYSLA